MSKVMSQPAKAPAPISPQRSPVKTGVLQRKCGCGQSAGGAGDCADCRKKSLQRKASANADVDPGTASPIVHEVLQSSGQPLDVGTRSLMESSFGHDFSKVRIHTDAKAAASAGAVDAHAYTVGRHVVFGTGQYGPDTPRGKGLLVHELTHVVQQSPLGDVSTGDRLAIGPPHDPFEQEADALAVSMAAGQPIHALSSALPESGLQRLSFGEFVSQIPILGPLLSGRAFGAENYTEGELLRYYTDFVAKGRMENHYDSDNKARAITKAWRLGGSPFDLTPRCRIVLIHEMQSGFTGSDDQQAILELLERSDNAALASMFRAGGVNAKDLNDDFQGEEFDRLKEFCERRFEGGMETLLQGTIKPVGVSVALGTALPRPNLYEQKLLEAYERLSGANFGPTGGLLPQDNCLPETKDTSAGPKTEYWYDKEFWEPDVHWERDADGKPQKSCKLRLLSGKSASAAIDAMFDHQGKWKIDCAQFVQIFHLYARRHTLGAKKFDEQFHDGWTLELRRRQSSGVETKVLFSRNSPTAKMTRSTDKKEEPKGIHQLLGEAPIGSRVRWTNLDEKAGARLVPTATQVRGSGVDTQSDWRNENSVKIGPDKYAAHPLFKFRFPFLLGRSFALSRSEIEEEMAKATNSKADAAYTQKYVFISEIEYFQEPVE